MNKFEIMRRIICGLFIWNLILTTGLFIGLYQKQQNDLYDKISNLEAIPPLEIIEEEV